MGGQDYGRITSFGQQNFSVEELEKGRQPRLRALVREDSTVHSALTGRSELLQSEWGSQGKMSELAVTLRGQHKSLVSPSTFALQPNPLPFSNSIGSLHSKFVKPLPSQVEDLSILQRSDFESAFTDPEAPLLVPLDDEHPSEAPNASIAARVNVSTL
jgi:hypothetical protein